MIKRIVLAWLALVALAMPVSAQTFPPLTGRVVDNARLLSDAQKIDIDSKLAALEAQSGRQLVVATIPSLEGRTIEDYGYRLGRTWAIGQKGEDDGVILLVAPNERKVRIETGYGARVFLTDAVSSVIIRDAITPRFKAGDMGGGIVAGIDQISSFLRLPDAEAQKRAAAVGASERERAKRADKPNVISIIFWMLIILFIVMPMVRGAAGGGRRQRGRSGPIILWGPGLGGGGGGWGGGGGGGFGGFGGGGFSGGGGGFGGGGASGGW